MSKQISCATTVLMESKTAAAKSERVLNAMLYHNQPVYIGIPTDVCYESIHVPLSLPQLIIEVPRNDEAVGWKAVANIREHVEASSKRL